MTLTALIRKRDLPVAASANPANFANATHPSEDKLAITANLALAASKQSEHSPAEKSYLASLVEQVLRADGWEEGEIAEAVQNALADYNDALICFTEQAQLNGITPETKNLLTQIK